MLHVNLASGEHHRNKAVCNDAEMCAALPCLCLRLCRLSSHVVSGALLLLLTIIAPWADALDMARALHPQREGDCGKDMVLLQAADRMTVRLLASPIWHSVSDAPSTQEYVK